MFTSFMTEGPAVVRIKRSTNKSQDWDFKSKTKKQTIRNLRQAKNNARNKLLG